MVGSEVSSVAYDIFISYRRQDAEAHACMLYRDLVNAGYTVFFDHKTLGAGDFIDNIHHAIDSSTDFLLLLSHDALGDRIYQDDDILRWEIAYAFKRKKQIVGIMLSGFEAFPKNLPDDISYLPHVNCLYGKMEYYEAMFDRLTSGQFLQSIPRKKKPETQESTELQQKEDALEWFKSFDLVKKQQYMKFLLDLAHEFNTSAPCMRLYKYLDCYDRNRGIRDTPAYDGIIPTDYTTYLNFFETLYLILITETIHISLIGEMYRFRFFAACNNPVIQQSELLALGYQYPNIMELYDFWSEYIRKSHLLKHSAASLNDEYPQFERDLHTTYRLYTFAQKPQHSQTIRFMNRSFERVDLTFSMLDVFSLPMVLDFQTSVLAHLPLEEELNLFEPLTEAEFTHSLKNDICIGVFDGTRIVALLNLIPKPQESQNILLGIPNYQDIDREQLLVVDCILVKDAYRGYGLQRAFLRLSEFIADKCGTPQICAVVSPRNSYSIANMVKSGFRFLGNWPKYHSTRDFFIKEAGKTTGL